MVSLPKKSFLQGAESNASLQLSSGADYSPLLDNETVESKTGGKVGLRDTLYKDIDDDVEGEMDDDGVEKNKLNMYFGVFNRAC